jgi:hypothetical protein
MWFRNPRPRILYSRSIDIVQNFHIPKLGEESAPHLSAILDYDLAIIRFGYSEKNIAVSPCVLQVVLIRTEEGKPTWIYLPSKTSIEECTQEKSPMLEGLLKDWKKVDLTEQDLSLKQKIKNKANNAAACFNVGKKK